MSLPLDPPCPRFEHVGDFDFEPELTEWNLTGDSSAVDYYRFYVLAEVADHCPDTGAPLRVKLCSVSLYHDDSSIDLPKPLWATGTELGDLLKDAAMAEANSRAGVRD